MAKSSSITSQILHDNLMTLGRIKDEMRSYVRVDSFDKFKRHGHQLNMAYDRLLNRLNGEYNG